MDCIVHGVTKSQIQLSDFHSIKISFRELLLQEPPSYRFCQAVPTTTLKHLQGEGLATF